MPERARERAGARGAFQPNYPFSPRFEATMMDLGKVERASVL